MHWCFGRVECRMERGSPWPSVRNRHLETPEIFCFSTKFFALIHLDWMVTLTTRRDCREQVRGGLMNWKLIVEWNHKLIHVLCTSDGKWNYYIFITAQTLSDYSLWGRMLRFTVLTDDWSFVLAWKLTFIDKRVIDTFMVQLVDKFDSFLLSQTSLSSLLSCRINVRSY